MEERVGEREDGRERERGGGKVRGRLERWDGRKDGREGERDDVKGGGGRMRGREVCCWWFKFIQTDILRNEGKIER